MGRWIVFSRLGPGRETGGAGSELDCKRKLRRPRRNCPGRLYPDTAATATWGTRPPWTESPPSLCCEPGPSARCWRLFSAVGCCSRASPPRPALPEGEGGLARGGQLHPGPEAGQWRSGRAGGCSCFSAPMEPCPDHAHRRPVTWAPLILHHHRLLSRWFARAFASAPGHGVACWKPLLPHRFPAAMLASCPKMQPGCFPVSPSLRPSLAVISLSPGSGTPQVRCPRTGISSSTRPQRLPVGSPSTGWGRALCSQSRQPS